MKGAALVNAYYQTEEIMYQPRRLKAEFSALGA